MTNVLIVESEGRLAQAMSDRLRRQGHTVTICGGLQDAERLLSRHLPDMLILEERLPDGESRALLRDQEKRQHVPTIVIASHGLIDRTVERLNDGADDYLRGPFSLPEFAARVRALFRRTIS